MLANPPVLSEKRLKLICMFSLSSAEIKSIKVFDEYEMVDIKIKRNGQNYAG